jgi:mono/diheme cytochrome c family protein
MHNQHKIEPYEKSTFFADGVGSRPIPPGTVPRGGLREGVFYSGLGAGLMPIAELPVELTPGLLKRGQERFGIFCAPCHDRAGTGRGMIVRRGLKQPSSFHTDRLRNVPVGYFFNVMTEGFGVMPSYRSQILAEDRWAIAAYVRALQYSQNARLAELTEEQRKTVEAQLSGEAAAVKGHDEH